MKSKLFLLAWFSLIGSVAMAADPEPYKVQRGDTLWDVSGRFWNDPETWPELWALNPQFHNPHIISPGDPVFLTRRGPEEATIHLPLVRLEPPPATQPAGPVGSGVQATPAVAETGAGAGGPVPRIVSPMGKGSQDFVSSHRIQRLGTVSNRRQEKVAYAEGEDVEFSVSGDSTLKPGDLATVFDDTEAVSHPVNRYPVGYHVRVLGYLRVTQRTGGKAFGRLIETYDTVEDGAGIMAHRPAIARVLPRSGKAGLEGVVLPSGAEKMLYASNDVVFLDRGSIHELEPGAVLEVPVPEGTRSAEGMVDLVRPLARLVVLSVEEKTAAGLIVDSRATVTAGDRFVATAFSP